MRAAPLSSTAYERAVTERGRRSWSRRRSRRRRRGRGVARRETNVRPSQHQRSRALRFTARSRPSARRRSAPAVHRAGTRAATQANVSANPAITASRASSSSAGDGREARVAVAPQQFLLDRRHRHVRDAARHEHVEEREVRRHVEREPVPGDPLPGVHADGGDLPARRPHARESLGAFAANVECRERANQRGLELAEVPVQVLLVMAQIDDRISDELSRPVKGDVAAALHVEEFDAAGGERVRARAADARPSTCDRS